MWCFKIGSTARHWSRCQLVLLGVSLGSWVVV